MTKYCRRVVGFLYDESSASPPLFVRGVQFLHTIRERETAILILAHGAAAGRLRSSLGAPALPGGNVHRQNENRWAWNSQIVARPPFRRGPAIPGVSSGSTSRSPGRTKRYSSAGGAGRHSPPAPRIPGNSGRPTSRGLRRSSKQASRRSTGPHRCVPVSDAAAPPIGLDGNRASRNRLESAGRRTTLRLYREAPLPAFRFLSQDIASQAEPRRAERIRGIPVGIDDGCARDPRDRAMDRSGTPNPPIPDACAC